MISTADVYKIGRIGKPHGIHGEMTMQVDDDVFDRVGADCLIIETEGLLVPFFIEEYRFRSDAVALVKLDGIDTQDDARAFTNRDVFFLRALAGDTEREPSRAEIIGYELWDAETGRVGTIKDIDDATINTLFIIERADGDELLVPVHDDFIEQIDPAARRITMRLPEGLIE